MIYMYGLPGKKAYTKLLLILGPPGEGCYRTPHRGGEFGGNLIPLFCGTLQKSL